MLISLTWNVAVQAVRTCAVMVCNWFSLSQDECEHGLKSNSAKVILTDDDIHTVSSKFERSFG